MPAHDGYIGAMQNVTILANATLVNIRTAAALGTRASMIEILRMYCNQGGSATSQQLGLRVGSNSGGSPVYVSQTPASLVIGSVASGIAGGTGGASATCGVAATTEATTFTQLWEEGFNNLNGWLWVPTPEERLLVPIDTSIALKIRGTPTTLTNWNAGIVYQELT